MDVLIVGGIAGAVAAVVGFVMGRRSARTSGGSAGGAAARSSGSGGTVDADAAFRLSLSRIGAYLRENVDAPLAAAFEDRSLSLRRAAEDAVASGFDATVAIHPTQVAVIRRSYAPDAERVVWAEQLLAHVGDDRSVTTFRGRMVDGPIYAQAERVLRLAAATSGGR